MDESLKEVKNIRDGLFAVIYKYMKEHNLEYHYIDNSAKIKADFLRFTRHIKIKNTDKYL